MPSRVIHEPARLASLIVLARGTPADFVSLQRITWLSKGNLSVQLTNLEKAGLVKSSKEITGKKTHTTLRLSERGAAELEQYWQTMDEIRRQMTAREEQQVAPPRSWSVWNPRSG